MGDDEICPTPHEATLREFVMVSLIGTGIALFCIMENLVLFYVLVSQKKFHTSNFFYLTILGLFDIFVGLSYIAIMTVQNLKDHLKSMMLSLAWLSYFRPLFTLSHITLTSSSHVILTATLERFIAARRIEQIGFNSRNRICAAVIAISAAIILKGTIFFEFKTVTLVNCTSRARYQVHYSSLANNNWYRSVWMFWIRNIFTVIIPFVSLMYMNIGIIHALRQHTKKIILETPLLIMGERLDETQETIKTATRLLILVVSTYLLATLPNFVLTVWEIVDEKSLFEQITFYFTTVDLVSLLTVLVGASRLPIYCSFNVDLRQEVMRLFPACCFRIWKGNWKLHLMAGRNSNQTELSNRSEDEMAELNRLDSSRSLLNHHLV